MIIEENVQFGFSRIWSKNCLVVSLGVLHSRDDIKLGFLTINGLDTKTTTKTNPYRFK